MSNGYAVVDVETTGRSPGHRVVEVAVVHVDPSGRRTDEWCTLVNPRRDLGDRHGISAADARRAPDFAGIAGELAARLAGRYLGASSRSLPAADSALRGARASAGLLVRCLDRVGDVSPVRLDVPRLVHTYAVQRSRGGRA